MAEGQRQPQAPWQPTRERTQTLTDASADDGRGDRDGPGRRRQGTALARDQRRSRRRSRRRRLASHGGGGAAEGRPATAGGQAISALFSIRGRPSSQHKAVFVSKLAALVNTGIPIVRSLDLLASQPVPPLLASAIRRVGEDVNHGVALGVALGRWPGVFDALSVAMVEAGETGGVLDEVLSQLAKLLEDNARLQNRIKGALGYPLTVLAVALAVFLGMTIVLIPTFAGLFAELGAELPAFTRLMLGISALLRSVWALLLAALLLLGVWLFSRYHATPKGRRRVDGMLLALPLFGDLIRKTATAQFCRTFCSLARAGVPILMSLEILRGTVGNSMISDAIDEAREAVRDGELLSVALAQRQVFPQIAISMLAIAEETGQMDAMLAKVADFHEDEVATTVKLLTSMLEPVMIVIVAGIVGSILLAMYLPMFSLFGTIE